jgi:hypothetical protein
MVFLLKGVILEDWSIPVHTTSLSLKNVIQHSFEEFAFLDGHLSCSSIWLAAASNLFQLSIA